MGVRGHACHGNVAKVRPGKGWSEASALESVQAKGEFSLHSKRQIGMVSRPQMFQLHPERTAEERHQAAQGNEAR